MKLTSSMVVAQAMGLAADGVPAQKDGHCAFCGAEIHVGDPYVPFSVGQAFMDDLSLAARGSDMTCGYCVHVLSADGLRKTGYGVFSLEDGFIPFRKWGELAAALMEPPKPPFVMTYATANNQHMAWRAPVNYSRDLFYVRVGLRDLKIRRPKLKAAFEVCQRAGIAMWGESSASSTRKTLPNPFRNLSSDLKDSTHADLTMAQFSHTVKNFEHLEHDVQYQADLKFLQGLTLGETWALRFVLTPNAGMTSLE